METYFKFRMWADFYIPLIILGIVLLIFVILFGIVALNNFGTQIKRRISEIPAVKSKRIAKQRAVLEKKGYEEILIDDIAYLAPYEVAHDEDPYIDKDELYNLFKVSELNSGNYSWDKINAAKDSQR